MSLYTDEEPWSRSIRAQFRARDQRQAHPYTEIFNHYNQVQTELELTRFQSKIQNNNGNTNSQYNSELRQYVSHVLSENQTLQRDLALMDERNSQNEGLLLSRQLRIDELRQLETDNKKLESYIQQSELALKNAGLKMDEQERLITMFRQSIDKLTKDCTQLREELAQKETEQQNLANATPNLANPSSVLFGPDDVRTESVAWSMKKPSIVPIGPKYHIKAPAGASSSQINCLTYHGQGSTVICGTSDGRVIFTQARTGKVGNSLEATKHSISAIASSPERGNIVFTDGDKHIFLYDTISRQRPARSILPAVGIGLTYITSDIVGVITKGRIDSMALYSLNNNNGSNAASQILSAGSTETNSFEELHLEQRLSTDSTPTAIASHPTTLGLATSHFDKSVKVWTQGTSELRLLFSIERVHNLRITSLAYHPTLPLLLTTSWDSRPSVIDTRTGQVVYQINGHLCNYINKLETGKASFCSDGIFVAAGSHDGVVKIWDTRMLPNLATNQQPKNFLECKQYPDGNVASLIPPAACVSEPVVAVEWNPNGRQVIAASHQNLVAYE